MKTNIRGYAGFYNGHFIRSSYEYVMVKIFLKNNIKYKYEEKTYKLNKLNCNYKPDFTIYENDKILKIIEVKGGRGKTLDKAYEKAQALKNEYNIEIEIYDIDKLIKACNENNLKFYTLIEEWKNISTHTSSDLCFGENNPMYGLHHSEETKSILRKKALTQWKRDRKYIIARTKEEMSKIDMKKVVANSNRYFAIYIEKECEHCKKIFKINPNNKKTANKKYCSNSCKNKHYPLMKKKSNLPQNEIRNKILNTVRENKNIILNIPFNNISKYINEIFGNLMNEYNIKDDRTLIWCYFGSKDKYRKDFINSLQQYLENIC